MFIEAYFCETKDFHDILIGNGSTVDGHPITFTEEVYGCIAYPVIITDAHDLPISHQGKIVVLIDLSTGEARGSWEMPPGELLLPKGFYDLLYERLTMDGYQARPIDDNWANQWANGIYIGNDHWNPGAKILKCSERRVSE